MKATWFVLAAAVLGIANQRGFAKEPPRTPVEDSSVARRPVDPLLLPAGVDTFVLAEYDFAGLDPQGWTTHDLHAVADTFFHVDDFSTVPGYAPLSGQRSLWCGTMGDPPAAGVLCACYPGYGNTWNQVFESVSFPATGDVTISFWMRYDTEPGYDYVRLEYLNTNGKWMTLMAQDGTGGPLPATFLVPAANLPGAIKVRFRFRSDGGYSDEDCILPTNGAVVLDDISISDANGILDMQDFESEPVGARATNDGHWFADYVPGYGVYARLYPGPSVLQEDPNRTVTGSLWGFFVDPSVYNYACGGHPEQGGIPQWGELDNEIQSPTIDWSHDESGNPIPSAASSALLEFDVYRDTEFDDLVFYLWWVRSIVDECPGLWQGRGFVYYGAEKAWKRMQFEFADLVESGATEIQVALEVVDGCPYACLPGIGCECCRGHAPLFTNVRVVRLYDTSTGAGPPGLSAALEQNIPNPFNPVTEIRYTIAQAANVSLVIYDVTGARVRELVARRQAPRGDGYRVTWDGTDDRGRRVASGVYYYRLVAGAFTQTRKMVLLK